MIDYVKIMPEYMANPIWDKDGIMMSWCTFDCPDDFLLNSLVRWNYECEQNEMEDNPANKLEIRGRKLAMNVKYYYPGATVMYQFNDKPEEITEGINPWRKVK